jgi:hypothetical protein
MTHSTAINKASQPLNSRPNPTSHLPSTPSHGTRTARWLVSLAAVLLVAASAGFGCYFAWHVGTAQHDTMLGVLSVAMALGTELCKPFAISSAFTALRQFRIITAAALTVVGLLAIGYSLQAELTFMSMTRSDLVAERASISDAAQRADGRYKEVEAELAALKPVSNKERDTDAYLRRREALQTELHQAEHDRQSAPVVSSPDPGATALAAYAASLGWQIDTRTLGLWLPLIGGLALELGAAFSVVLVRAVNADRVAHVAHAHSAGDVVAHIEAADSKTDECAPLVAQNRAILAKRRQKKRRVDDDDKGAPRKRGLSGLLDAVQGSGGKVVALSQRKLARKIGVSRRTLERAMRDAAEAGAVMLETGRSGTRLALA